MEAREPVPVEFDFGLLVGTTDEEGQQIQVFLNRRAEFNLVFEDGRVFGTDIQRSGNWTDDKVLLRAAQDAHEVANRKVVANDLEWRIAADGHRARTGKLGVYDRDPSICRALWRLHDRIEKCVPNTESER